MQPGGVYPSPPPEADDPLGRLAASAKGWHSIQMAVLGFIGICGVLQTGDGTGPSWLQWLAALLAGSALVVAILAIAVVGQVAYPFYGGTTFGPTDPQRIMRASARLRTGIRTTFVAVVLIVVAALSGWWPAAAGAAGSVEVREASGRTWCGTVVQVPSGNFGVRTADGVVALPMELVVSVRPTSGC